MLLQDIIGILGYHAGGDVKLSAHLEERRLMWRFEVSGMRYSYFESVVQASLRYVMTDLAPYEVYQQAPTGHDLTFCLVATEAETKRLLHHTSYGELQRTLGNEGMVALSKIPFETLQEYLATTKGKEDDNVQKFHD